MGGWIIVFGLLVVIGFALHAEANGRGPTGRFGYGFRPGDDGDGGGDGDGGSDGGGCGGGGGD